LTACNGITSGAPNFTFSTPDAISLNDPTSGTQTVNQVIAGSTLTGCAPAAVCAMTGTAGSAGNPTGAISTWYDFHYTLGTSEAGAVLAAINHDDGIALFVNGAVVTPTNESVASAAAPQSLGLPTNYTLPGTAVVGATIDLVYDECCGGPATLSANLPGEAPIPSPAALYCWAVRFWVLAHC
jgi:hypothetical protein